jgi:hypothetical protein
MSRCVVVLGMHRSGTSCVTRMLHHLGVYLGDNVDDEPVPTNLTGHWEAGDIIAVNDAILAQSGGTWDDVPEQLVLDLECDEKIKRVLALLALQPLYGWKDPRTTITFPAWKRHLPEHLVLACIRHPMAVAQSLEVRDGFDVERGLRLWTAYNRHLLQHLASEPEVFWFPYDEPQDVLQSHLRRLCARLQVPYREDAITLFNRYLRHGRAGDHPAATEAIELYQTLLESSRKSLSEDPQPAQPLEPETAVVGNDRVLNDDVLDAAARERSLHEVLRNFSTAQQRYWRAVHSNQQAGMARAERVIEERLALGIERATVERQRIVALEEKAMADNQRIVALEGRATVDAQRIVALEGRATADAQRIIALEGHLARVEACSLHNVARRLLARIPGLRPMYRMARRVVYAGR